MLELKNFSGIITNSSSEVYVFDKGFEKFFENYKGDLNFIHLDSENSIEKSMKFQTVQTKLLEYCDIFCKSWKNLEDHEKQEVKNRLLGKTFLFNYKSDPEENKFWYPSKEECDLLKNKYSECYVD